MTPSAAWTEGRKHWRDSERKLYSSLCQCPRIADETVLQYLLAGILSPLPPTEEQLDMATRARNSLVHQLQGTVSPGAWLEIQRQGATCASDGVSLVSKLSSWDGVEDYFYCDESFPDESSFESFYQDVSGQGAGIMQEIMAATSGTSTFGFVGVKSVKLSAPSSVPKKNSGRRMSLSMGKPQPLELELFVALAGKEPPSIKSPAWKCMTVDNNSLNSRVRQDESGSLAWPSEFKLDAGWFENSCEYIHMQFRKHRSVVQDSIFGSVSFSLSEFSQVSYETLIVPCSTIDKQLYTLQLEGVNGVSRGKQQNNSSDSVQKTRIQDPCSIYLAGIHHLYSLNSMNSSEGQWLAQQLAYRLCIPDMAVAAFSLAMAAVHYDGSNNSAQPMAHACHSFVQTWGQLNIPNFAGKVSLAEGITSNSTRVDEIAAHASAVAWGLLAEATFAGCSDIVCKNLTTQSNSGITRSNSISDQDFDSPVVAEEVHHSSPSDNLLLNMAVLTLLSGDQQNATVNGLLRFAPEFIYDSLLSASKAGWTAFEGSQTSANAINRPLGSTFNVLEQMASVCLHTSQNLTQSKQELIESIENGDRESFLFAERNQELHESLLSAHSCIKKKQFPNRVMHAVAVSVQDYCVASVEGQLVVGDGIWKLIDAMSKLYNSCKAENINLEIPDFKSAFEDAVNLWLSDLKENASIELKNALEQDSMEALIDRLGKEFDALHFKRTTADTTEEELRISRIRHRSKAFGVIEALADKAKYLQPVEVVGFQSNQYVEARAEFVELVAINFWQVFVDVVNEVRTAYQLSAQDDIQHILCDPNEAMNVFEEGIGHIESFFDQFASRVGNAGSLLTGDVNAVQWALNSSNSSGSSPHIKRHGSSQGDPRNLVHGAGQAAKGVVSSLLDSAMDLYYMPVAAYKQEGLGKAAKGFVKGVTNLVARPAENVIQGAVLISKGARRDAKALIGGANKRIRIKGFGASGDQDGKEMSFTDALMPWIVFRINVIELVSRAVDALWKSTIFGITSEGQMGHSSDASVILTSEDEVTVQGMVSGLTRQLDSTKQLLLNEALKEAFDFMKAACQTIILEASFCGKQTSSSKTDIPEDHSVRLQRSHERLVESRDGVLFGIEDTVQRVSGSTLNTVGLQVLDLIMQQISTQLAEAVVKSKKSLGDHDVQNLLHSTIISPVAAIFKQSTADDNDVDKAFSRVIKAMDYHCLEGPELQDKFKELDLATKSTSDSLSSNFSATDVDDLLNVAQAKASKDVKAWATQLLKGRRDNWQQNAGIDPSEELLYSIECQLKGNKGLISQGHARGVAYFTQRRFVFVEDPHSLTHRSRSKANFNVGPHNLGSEQQVIPANLMILYDQLPSMSISSGDTIQMHGSIIPRPSGLAFIELSAICLNGLPNIPKGITQLREGCDPYIKILHGSTFYHIPKVSSKADHSANFPNAIQIPVLPDKSPIILKVKDHDVYGKPPVLGQCSIDTRSILKAGSAQNLCLTLHSEDYGDITLRCKATVKPVSESSDPEVQSSIVTLKLGEHIGSRFEKAIDSMQTQRGLQELNEKKRDKLLKAVREGSSVKSPSGESSPLSLHEETNDDQPLPHSVQLASQRRQSGIGALLGFRPENDKVQAEFQLFDFDRLVGSFTCAKMGKFGTGGFIHPLHVTTHHVCFVHYGDKMKVELEDIEKVVKIKGFGIGSAKVPSLAIHERQFDDAGDAKPPQVYNFTNFNLAGTGAFKGNQRDHAHRLILELARECGNTMIQAL